MSQVVQNHQQALNVLVQAAQTANKRGAFSLEESGVIASAVSVFMPPAPPETEAETEAETKAETVLLRNNQQSYQTNRFSARRSREVL